MADWPCRNPNCKSNGQPHPNCQCGPPGANGYAEGGEVEHYCSALKEHDKNCQYYSSGGNVVPDSDLPSESPKEEVPQEDLPSDLTTSSEVPQEDLPTGQYETPGQQLLTGVEGAARGVAGPLATAAELGLSKLGVPGISAEDQAGREAANPVIHGASEAGALAGSMFLGVGEARLAVGAAEATANAAKLGAIGSTLLRGAVEGAAIQSGDEISKAMLGQGDPEHPVAAALAHIGAAGLFGGITHGIFSPLGKGTNKGFQALENAKLGTKAENFLRGLGAKAKGVAAHELEIPPSDKMAFKAGEKAHELLSKSAEDKVSKGLASGIAGTASTVLPGGIVTYEVLKNILEPFMGGAAKKVVSAANKYAPAAASKAMSMGETTKLFYLLDHASNIGKGAQKMTDGIEALFKAGEQEGISHTSTDKDRDKLKKFIEEGGINTQIENEAQQSPQPAQTFAEGGDVQIQPEGDGLAKVYPEQDMMLQAAKGRVFNYLNTVRPSTPMAQKPFDTHVPDKTKERGYNKALDVANNPLSVLDHIRKGTLDPEHVKHLNAMYPEIHNVLSKKIMERSMHAAMKGHKPSYKARMGMSMFLGQPLDSTMSPAAIMAAQSTSISQKQTPPPQAPKHSTAPLSKLPGEYKTASQSLEARQQRDK